VNAPLPRIAITPGEPAGVGPDLLVTIAQQAWPAELVAIADPHLLEERARSLNLPLTLQEWDAVSPRPSRPGHLSILPIAMAETATPGKPAVANAPYVLETLRRATRGCLNHEFAALVTGPVHKGIINEAGQPFTGHTEYLAGLTATDDVVMLLAAPGLRVALATTHLPLAEVPAALSKAGLTTTLTILHTALRERFGIERPRISVLGLNPHAGEGGHLGREEIGIIEPVIRQLKQQGLELTGPLPADTAFQPASLQQTDAFLAMYHDQGLPVLKHLGFGQAVNITLGLPMIRTSVDHGTACELAGSGRADTGSLRIALQTAIEMCNIQD